MKFNKLWYALILALFIAGCGGSGGGGGGSSSSSGGGGCSSTAPVLSGNNYMTVTVNGSYCNALYTGYTNKPCVRVTICNAGTTCCDTIDDILLDTGSFGLRIFKQALTNFSVASPVTAQDSSHYVGNCAAFGGGNLDWGPVFSADVIMGGQKASAINIQIIDKAWGDGGSKCKTAWGAGYSLDSGPSDASFNGILGVGNANEDCGAYCVSHSNNGSYYSCSGSSCSNYAMPAALTGQGTYGINVYPKQVQNPISFLPDSPGDNNGLVVVLPGVSATTGAATVSGMVLFGVGTKLNNTPDAGVAAYATDNIGYITTKWQSTTYNSSNSFLDTGSNGLFFPNTTSPVISTCSSGSANGWYCPAATKDLSAQICDYSTSLSCASVNFQIVSASTLFATGNYVFSTLGAPNTSDFDWGLPFFLNRTVYIGFDGKSATGFSSGTVSGAYNAF